MKDSGVEKINRIGAFCAMLAALCFSSNDVGIKFLSGAYALHQVVLLRTFFGIAFILVLISPFNGGWRIIRTKRLKIHISRGLCVVFANMCFFLALATMQLADAVAIVFISPLLITVFSIIFLSEKVGRYRWSAIGVGLLGVIIIVRPGTSAFQVVSLLPLFAAVGYASFHTLTRKIGSTESAATLALYIQLTFLIVCLLVGFFIGDGRYATSSDPSLKFLLRAWVWPELNDIWIFLIVGVGSACGGFLISQAYRISEAAFVAPFEYIAMPLAILWGAIFFNEWPDPVAWSGIVLIVTSGLFTLWRETVRQTDIR